MVDNVDAEVIEQDLAVLSKAERWLADASSRVAERTQLYRVPESIEDSRQYKAAKESRAAARKDAAEIDAERKAMLRQIEDRVKEFKGAVKDILAPLTAIDEEYKALIDAYDEKAKVDREILLATEYESQAPDLVDLVPFSLILSHYGSGTGKDNWLLRSTNIEVAKDRLADAIYDIAEGEKAIDSLVGDEERAEAKARYFQTLDLNRTLSEARAAKAQRLRVEQMERERRAREMAYAAPEPMSEPVPETAAPNVQPSEWYITIHGTRADAERVASVIRESGERFESIRSGNSWQLVRR